MPCFDYTQILPRLLTPSLVKTLGAIREYRGKQELYQRVRPETLERLCQVAKIQSTGASNRIENIHTSERRLRDLMAQKVEPANRDEREIAGYRYVLDLVHESHDHIPLTPSVILQLHRDLYRFVDSAYAGHWKDADNVIAERLPTGELVARFRPASAAATPGAVEELCQAYNSALRQDAFDPILPSLLFAFDFVSIHPFNDGNGRMSRLLTLLVLYRAGYTVGKYISLESLIEQTKESYYEALQASSWGWQEGANDPAPFVEYMLGIVLAAYRELDERMGALESDANEETLRAFFDRTLGKVTKREIMDAHPNVSQKTIERILQRLQTQGVIEKVGAARNTAYRKREG